MALVRGLVAFQLIGLFASSMYSNVEANKLMWPPLAPGPSPMPEPAPPKTPSRPIKLRAAVEGVVYCTSCKLPGYVPELKASPLPGVAVTLTCDNLSKKVSTNGNATTDSHGYFLLQVQNRRPSGLKTCKLFLESPGWCREPVFPKFPGIGVPFKYERIYNDGYVKNILYAAGLIQFGPSRPDMCPRQP